tara:strand:+ start:81 stop:563 length:483 start_codon:yes stop_codon:yes gene_type:complete
MKEYLSEDIANTTSVLLYKLRPSGDLSLEAMHKKINDRLEILKYKKFRRFRGIYKTPDYGEFIVASGFECDPKRPNKFFTDEFMDEFYDALGDMDPHLIATVCTTDYLARCSHTENARAALLCLESNDNYIIKARQEIQHIAGGLPSLDKIINGRLKNVA